LVTTYTPGIVSSMPGKKTKPAGEKPSTSRAKLPAALAKRAEQAVAAKRARTAKEARADIALIKRRKKRIAEDFYDIGVALARLKRPGVAEVLGRESFREICEKDLEMSPATADKLVAIVANVAREDALRMGQERALALVALARATPEADSAASLEKAVRKLPSGKKLDVRSASVRDLREAAKDVRDASGKGGRPRGRTTSPAERAEAAKLEAALRKAGLDRARVAAVATKPGQGADLRIERVPVAQLTVFRKALREG
jgi:hypothetical protein